LSTEAAEIIRLPPLLGPEFVIVTGCVNELLICTDGNVRGDGEALKNGEATVLNRWKVRGKQFGQRSWVTVQVAKKPLHAPDTPLKPYPAQRCSGKCHRSALR
jgi:hypothetical protein